MPLVDAVETNASGARRTEGEAHAQAQVHARAHAQAHARADRHSARVRRLRRLIPVAAGGSVVLLAAAILNPFQGAVPGVSVGPVTLAGTKVRMENPKLSGFRKGERGYEVTAHAALQDMRKPSLIELEAMRGHISTDDKGGIARLEAASGLFDTSREALDLDRDIRIWTDKGEEAVLKSAAVDFKAGTVRSTETVRVSVPTGQVVADGLDVVDNGRVISFVGNVRAVFNGAPGQGDGKAEAPPRILTSSAEPPDLR